MAYTDATTVRRYISTPSPRTERVSDHPVALTGEEPVGFFAGAVDPATVVVKARRAVAPLRQTVRLADSPTLLASVPLVPGSVVMASDSSLGTIFTENVDYLIDHAAAQVTIVAGGGLTPGGDVTVWYQPYKLCVSSDDYVLDAAQGEIRRRDGIASGETVYLDYTPLHLNLSDELVDSAVATANGMIEREVDPAREFEADTTLANAAVYRALELLSRAAAARELASLRGVPNVALAWLKLADDYANQSETLVRSFRAPQTGLRGPVRS